MPLKRPCLAGSEPVELDGKSGPCAYALQKVQTCRIYNPWSTQCNPPELIGGAPFRSGASLFSPTRRCRRESVGDVTFINRSPDRGGSKPENRHGPSFGRKTHDSHRRSDNRPASPRALCRIPEEQGEAPGNSSPVPPSCRRASPDR